MENNLDPDNKSLASIKIKKIRYDKKKRISIRGTINFNNSFIEY